MNIKWDADKFTSDFSFVDQYGNSVIELIDADQNSSVLDLGCGNGALTNALYETVFHWIDKERQPDMLKCVCNVLKMSFYFPTISEYACIDGKWYADYVRIRMKAVRL